MCVDIPVHVLQHSVAGISGVSQCVVVPHTNCPFPLSPLEW